MLKQYYVPKIKIPKSPDQLLDKAKPLYDEIYKTLIKEDRGEEKYNITVAMAANALYFYKGALETADNMDQFTDTIESARIINTLAKTSGEYQKFAKALLLTPESEKLVEVPIEPKDKPQTLAEALGKNAGSRNDNYSNPKPQKRKARENAAKIKK